MHRHLHRLSRIYLSQPQYFVTTCSRDRRPVLASDGAHQIFCEEWQVALKRHGWMVGRYVIMPDHVHFFCAEHMPGKELSVFVGAWKEWTSKRLLQELNLQGPIWQPEFFDHVLRSNESFAEKWEYVRQNPVRAGLVRQADGWPYQGHVHYDAHWMEEPASTRPATGRTGET
jgi:putative transposase